jgi:hypothetical protein
MRCTLLALVIVLAGCGEAVPKTAPQARHERREAAEAQAARTPAPLVYRYADGELRSFDVPTLAPGSALIETQKCFVWRDQEFKTASISCPQPPELVYSKD